jgi:hypothetical protein
MTNSRENQTEGTFRFRRETLLSILNTSIPLNGSGYFQVNNSVVTSVIGAATTYIVVLLQFNISEQEPNKEQSVTSNNSFLHP